jgi:acyl-CoA synthetase (AMP-forming)/AMP-acid ligase II
MTPAHLLHELIAHSAKRSGDAPALTSGKETLGYAELDTQCRQFAAGLLELGLTRGERVGVYLEKRSEFVSTAFGTAAAGGAFVPLNPLLKPEQVAHILCDCNVRVLVTSTDRLALLKPALTVCHDLRQVVIIGNPSELPGLEGASTHAWSELFAAPPRGGHRVIDTDMAAILYTSGSTGRRI